MEAQSRELRLYLREDGTSSFDLWLDGLRDNEAKAQVRLRLKRVVLGNLGDYKPVGDGVYELRIDYGPQNRDILRAKEYWKDYEQRQTPND